MQRLLQGDVGSGKTLVARAALLRGRRAGGQAALMAPTETLADAAPAATLERCCEPLGVRGDAARPGDAGARAARRRWT